jgi:hypothetical protein
MKQPLRAMLLFCFPLKLEVLKLIPFITFMLKIKEIVVFFTSENIWKWWLQSHIMSLLLNLMSYGQTIQYLGQVVLKKSIIVSESFITW